MTKGLGIAVSVLGVALCGMVGCSLSSPSPTTQTPAPPVKILTLDLGNSVTMKLVLIPVGKFMMGSSDSEVDREGDECPQHEVTVSKPFYLGIYPVTQEQWEQLMGTNVSLQRDKANKGWPLYGEGATYPMYYVSWAEAVEYCKKFSQKTGKSVHLPTEAQWEYACRAGSPTRFYYGDDDDYSQLGDYAWYSGNSSSKTHPVGQKKPNNWGLYDMCGNVQQWCSELSLESYTNSKYNDPERARTNSYRVFRGGSSFDIPMFCRSARRSWDSSETRYASIGFRVVVDVK